MIKSVEDLREQFRKETGILYTESDDICYNFWLQGRISVLKEFKKEEE